VTDTVARVSPTTALAAFLLVAGIALAGYGVAIHVETAGYLSAGECDGCSPWHPLLVVAPILVGTATALGSGYALVRR